MDDNLSFENLMDALKEANKKPETSLSDLEMVIRGMRHIDVVNAMRDSKNLPIINLKRK